jgi:metallo-beta-lactamase family protein
MQISFHGAARTVTGSKHLLSLANGVKVLLDCGMFQGMGQQTDELNMHFGFNPTEIDYLILSHAHIDHSGLIPKLVKEGFKGKIFCTPATKDLTDILLQDSAVIQRDDTKYINRKREKKGLPLFEPMYSLADANAAMELFNTVNYNSWFTISNDIELLFTDAGHIIGSAAISLKIKENGKTSTLTFSGDVGRYGDVILRSPEEFPPADYIICESTYGNKLHEKKTSSANNLFYHVNHTCVEKKGNLVIPAFSVGRTQEILYWFNQLEIEKRLPKVKYFVDSPLSVEATEVVKKHMENFNKTVKQVLLKDKNPFDFNGLTYIESVDESKQIKEYPNPCVIISASGMAEAGRIKHHIKNNLSDEKNTILLVGYCSPYSLGGKLMNGVKKVNIYGDELQVIAQVEQMHSMSAHGDYNDLSHFLACQDVKKVKKLFLVHGEYDVQLEFASRLQSKGFEVEVPDMHSAVNLS